MNAHYRPNDGKPAGTRDLTVVSLSGDVPNPPDKNFHGVDRDPRMLRAGHLTAGTARAVCYIHMVSAGGMMAETGLAMAPRDKVSVELRPGHPIAGEVLWVDGALVGIRFAGWIDLLRMLGNDSIEGFTAAAGGRTRTTLPMLRRPAPGDDPR